MVRCSFLALATYVALGAVQSAGAAECFDVSNGEPRTLTGILDYAIFPGPPNFKDVQGGDAPEPNFILRLSAPICIAGDTFADPEKPFKAVQVMETDATAGRLRPWLHSAVTLTLKGPMAAETGHHHEPLVAWVTMAQLAGPVPEGGIVETGTAATTVRSFYEALGAGQGEVASLMVAPEKRGIPAFTASAMSRFYGDLREPIRLAEFNQSGPDTFAVRYRYATTARACDGRAIVTTSSRAGTTYIESIRALDGC